MGSKCNMCGCDTGYAYATKCPSCEKSESYGKRASSSSSRQPSYSYKSKEKKKSKWWIWVIAIIVIIYWLANS